MRRLLATLTALAVLALTACSGGGTEAAEHEETVPTITDESQYVSPLDGYFPTRAEQQRYVAAFKALLSRCVERFGLQYTPVGRPIESSYVEDSDVPANVYNDGMGVVSEARASRFGYHDPVKVPPVPAPPTDASRSPEELAQLAVVVNGSAPVSNQDVPRDRSGGVVPDGGCFGEATRALDGTRGPQRPRSDFQLAAVSDPRVDAARLRWVACMKDKGFTDAVSPTKYGFSYNHPDTLPTRQEVATALADVACKRSSNIAGVYVAVKRRLESRALASQQTAYDAYRRWSARVRANVERVLVASAG